MSFTRQYLSFFIGNSSETKPIDENWIPEGAFWWEPDTGDYYRYIEGDDGADPPVASYWEIITVSTAAIPEVNGGSF